VVANLRRRGHTEKLLEVEGRCLLCVEFLVLSCLRGALHLLLLLLLSRCLVLKGLLAGDSGRMELRDLLLLMLLLVP